MYIPGGRKKSLQGLSENLGEMNSQSRSIICLSEQNMNFDSSLNFYPYYEELLRAKQKTKTVRLGDQTSKYPIGKSLILTCGWEPSETVEVARVEVLDCYSKPIRSLTDSDLEGESPDCVKVQAVPFVLSAIYKRVVSEDDIVTVIRWTYVG